MLVKPRSLPSMQYLPSSVHHALCIANVIANISCVYKLVILNLFIVCILWQKCNPLKLFVIFWQLHGILHEIFHIFLLFISPRNYKAVIDCVKDGNFLPAFSITTLLFVHIHRKKRC